MVLGIVFGFLVGLFVTAAVDAIGNMIAPPPTGVNLTDPEQLRTALPSLATDAKIAMVLSWFLGTLSGVSVANMVAGRRRISGLILSAVFGLLLGFSAYSVAYPLWMAAASLAGWALATYTADRAFGRKKT